MKFVDVQRVFPEQRLWGASKGIYSFIISQEPDDVYIASAKIEGSLPFQGERWDLGEFELFTEAVEACKKFSKEHIQ